MARHDLTLFVGKLPMPYRISATEVLDRYSVPAAYSFKLLRGKTVNLIIKAYTNAADSPGISLNRFGLRVEASMLNSDAHTCYRILHVAASSNQYLPRRSNGGIV